jgi:aspartate kinase
MAASRVVVMKFGGTSMLGSQGTDRVASILAASHPGVVAVVSAMAGTTDRLIQGVEEAAAGGQGLEAAAAATRLAHLTAAEDLLTGPELADFVAELEEVMARYMAHATQMAASYLDPGRSPEAAASAGELLSASLLAAVLRLRGMAATSLDSSDLLFTDGHPLAGTPLMPESRERVRGRLLPLLQVGTLPVLTGFRARTAAGQVTTLGRGGSDHSATLIAATLPADEVWIWTDVDGILTADPRLVPEARLLPEVSYAEAMELSYFGAKVLHRSAVPPAASAAIPILIKNTMRPDGRGTVIGGRAPGPGGARAVTLVEEACLMTLTASPEVGLNRLAGEVFGRFADARITTLLVTQSSAEDVICVAIPAVELPAARNALRQTSYLRRQDVQSQVSVVVVVGEAMRGTPGIAGKMFGALGQEGINVIAISQGSSELAVAAVVQRQAVAEAVRVLHRVFALGGSAQMPEGAPQVLR